MTVTKASGFLELIGPLGVFGSGETCWLKLQKIIWPSSLLPNGRGEGRDYDAGKGCLSCFAPQRTQRQSLPKK